MSEDFDFSSYVPSDDEDFMNAKQKAYFRAKLIDWRNDILKEARETLDHLAEESANHPDVADRDPVDRGAGAARAAREGLPRRVIGLRSIETGLQNRPSGRFSRSGVDHCSR
jgi:DnaK suppressor protein